MDIQNLWSDVYASKIGAGGTSAEALTAANQAVADYQAAFTITFTGKGGGYVNPIAGENPFDGSSGVSSTPTPVPNPFDGSSGTTTTPATVPVPNTGSAIPPGTVP